MTVVQRSMTRSSTCRLAALCATGFISILTSGCDEESPSRAIESSQRGGGGGAVEPEGESLSSFPDGVEVLLDYQNGGTKNRHAYHVRLTETEVYFASRSTPQSIRRKVRSEPSAVTDLGEEIGPWSGEPTTTIFADGPLGLLWLNGSSIDGRGMSVALPSPVGRGALTSNEDSYFATASGCQVLFALDGDRTLRQLPVETAELVGGTTHLQEHEGNLYCAAGNNLFSVGASLTGPVETVVDLPEEEFRGLEVLAEELYALTRRPGYSYTLSRVDLERGRLEPLHHGEHSAVVHLRAGGVGELLFVSQLVAGQPGAGQVLKYSFESNAVAPVSPAIDELHNFSVHDSELALAAQGGIALMSD